ncbi:phosphate propanoyltransferase [Andreesenia angusta]|uniref:Phosphate propanoyltransferase n=1 Tax=Andreesenia angusta TaxID=39480 RepID=A0A1S1V8W2_9FIRM|nr:phosphate propanoyltransferase [Andreesenia angusta]OHW62845.1 phosphate propanoyltransferase [Andreesenia angusta]
MKNKLPIALSNRHVHLSESDLEKLFGGGHSLCELKSLSQPGQFACEEKVDLVGPRGTIPGVRVLGPTRDITQVEISFADARKLGVDAPVKESGDIEGSPGLKLVGPNGEVDMEQGAIVAARHIHFSDKDAEEFGVSDGEKVKIKTSGDRSLVFENVTVRVSPKYSLEMHVDLEEGNAAGVSNGDLVEIIR